MEEANRFITFIWSCANSLVPKTNGKLLSFISLKKPYCYAQKHELAVLAYFFGK